MAYGGVYIRSMQTAAQLSTDLAGEKKKPPPKQQNHDVWCPRKAGEAILPETEKHGHSLARRAERDHPQNMACRDQIRVLVHVRCTSDVVNKAHIYKVLSE